MKDYFSHDYNARNDKKIVKASMKFDLCLLIGAYWCIVEMLYEEGGYLNLDEHERITFELRCKNELIKFLIYESELFVNDGVKFWSNTAIERLKLRSEKSQKARDSIKFRWERKQNDTNVLQSKNDSNTSKVNIKEKENKVNEIESKENAISLENYKLFKEKQLSSTRLEQICLTLKIKSVDECRNLVTEFFGVIELRQEELSRNDQELNSYMINWLRQESSKIRPQNKFSDYNPAFG